MGNRVLDVLARRRSWLDRFALGLLVFVVTLIAALMGGARAQEVETVRAATVGTCRPSLSLEAATGQVANTGLRGNRPVTEAHKAAAELTKNA